MTYVTHGLSPQIVEEGEEIIFSYDVIFKVHTLSLLRQRTGQRYGGL